MLSVSLAPLHRPLTDPRVEHSMSAKGGAGVVEAFVRALSLGLAGLVDIGPYMSIIEMAGGSHVCTPMRVENLGRQGLGSGSAPRLLSHEEDGPLKAVLGLLLVPPGVLEIKDFLVCEEIELIR